MTTTTVFESIFAPLKPLLTEQTKLLKGDDYTLSFYFFTQNLIYVIIARITSISLLVTTLKSSADTAAFNLVEVSKSMYSEAFRRYDPTLFQKLFLSLLAQLEFMGIPEIQALGRFILMDGSIFPAIKTMDWAVYKSSKNALKLHLSFELNRMIPVQFICTDANGNERKVLAALLEVGVTYIADRGYASFAVFEQITKQQAFFIIRIKYNIKYALSESLVVNGIPENWLPFLSEITDSLIVFSKDKQKLVYRLVTFSACGEIYHITTNRLDLTTAQIIMLYAYRWQIELFFRVLKRTFNALHLWTYDERGIQSQFYIYLITYLLLIHFKQKLNQAAEEKVNVEKSKTSNRKSRKLFPPTPERGIVTILSKKLSEHWKIGVHWLETLKNRLRMPLNPESIELLISQQ
jgi:Transposase DDE domain